MDIKEEDKIIKEVTRQEYKEGFVTEVGQDFIPKGLNEHHLAAQGGAGMDAGIPARCFQEVAEDGDARVGSPGHA